MAKRKINVQDTEIILLDENGEDYISLTNIANKFGEANPLIRNWIRSINTMNYLAEWEQLSNENFKPVGFDGFKNELTTKGNAFSMSAKKWIEGTDSVGIIAKSGRYGGTYAHSDIAMHFCYWLNPIFQLYLIKEFQRLKIEEGKRLGLHWNLRRTITKSNYHIHTDAVREHLVPLMEWHTKQESIKFATEADLLNMAVFGLTAKEWKIINPELKGNMRDHATEIELQVISNMESINATLLGLKFNKDERLNILVSRATREIEILEDLKMHQEQKKLSKAKKPSEAPRIE